MSQNVANGMEAPQRIRCLDFLRGFFVFLALWQHFAFYINYWYLDYHGGWSFWGVAFEPHVAMVGNQIAVDHVSWWAAWFFTPWVSQVYLFLAAFNLAKRDQHEVRKNITGKLMVFLALFGLFTIENMVVAPNIGEAISLYPLQTWMLILGSVIGAYAWLGERGVWLLFILGIVRLALPLEYLYEPIEQYFRNNLHENFEIDARPDYFLASGALGFLLGCSWWRDGSKDLLKWLVIGVAAWLVWLIFGESFTVKHDDVFATEHDLARTFFGSIGIHGIELMVVSAALLIKTRWFDLHLPIINWIGKYSLLVFFLHRIIFLKVLMPIRMLMVEAFGMPLEGSFIEFWIEALLIAAFAWMIKKTRLLQALEGRG